MPPWDTGEHVGNGNHRRRIGRPNAKQERFEKTSCDEAAHESRTKAPSDHRRPLTHHESQQTRGGRAQRGANPDLARSLHDGVRHDTVESQCREHDSDGGKCGQQDRAQAVGRQIVRFELHTVLISVTAWARSTAEMALRIESSR
jgi:hypothetical protein